MNCKRDNVYVLELPMFWMGLTDLGHIGNFIWMHSRAPYSRNRY